MNLMSNVRLMILLVLVALSAYSFFSATTFSSGGVFVSSVDQGAGCVGLVVGGRVNQVGGRNVKTVDDFENAVANIKKGAFVPLLVDSKPGSCVAPADGDVGFAVTSQSAASFGPQLGLELGGGISYAYQLNGNVSPTAIASIINKRAIVFGFSDVKTESFDNMIKITTSSKRDINILLYPGVIEARMSKNIKLQNSAGTFSIGDDTFNFTLEDGGNSLVFGGKKYLVGDYFLADDVRVYYVNSTETNVVLEAVVFDNGDIERVVPEQSTLEYIAEIRQYQFQIPALITQKASEMFQKINERAATTLSGGKIVIDGSLVSYFDGKEISRLGVPLEFARAPLQSIGITGFAQTNEAAKEERLAILASLQSGTLKHELVFVNQEQVQPTMKELALMVFLVAAGFSFALTAIASIRYKNIKAGMAAFVLILTALFATVGIINFEVAFYGSNFVFGINTVYALSASAVMMGILFVVSCEKMIRAKEMTIKIGYRRLMGMKTFVYLASVIVSVAVAISYDRIFGIFIFFAMLLDWLIVSGIREKFIRK